MASDPLQRRRELRILSASQRERGQLIREQQGPELQRAVDLFAQVPDDADINCEELRAQIADASVFLRAQYESFASSFLTLSKLAALSARDTGTNTEEEVDELEEQGRTLREFAEQLDFLVLVAKVQRERARLLERLQ